MARPKKQVVDYFPHVAQQGKTLFILESRWGNDGYAFWFKLLETLCQTNGHAYDYGNPSDREYLLAKTRVGDDLAIDILNKLAELGKIDLELWEEKIIWCQHLVDNVNDAYKKRIDEIPEKPSLRIPKPVISEFPTPETPLEVVSVNGSTQSKVNKTKPKKIIVNKNKYGEFENVLLTIKEHDKLIDDYGFDTFNKIIIFFGSYIVEKNYKSESHNLAIRRWVVEAVNKQSYGNQQPKKSKTQQGLDDFERKMIELDRSNGSQTNKDVFRQLS